MTELNDTYGRIYENLIDAGCDEQTTEKCMSIVKSGRYLEMLPILSQHRKILLDMVHSGQKKIDCLDYLVYQIKGKK